MSKTRLRDRTSAWWTHHQTSATGSLSRLIATPLQTLMTAMVVAIALALPTTLLVFLNNVEKLGERWDASPKLSVFLQLRAQPLAIEELQKQLQSEAGIQAVQFISAEQALVEFQARSGFGEVLEVLDENPLPPTLVVTPDPEAFNPEQLAQLAGRIEQEAIVDQVDMDMAWVRRLKEIMALGKQIVLGLALLLSLGVLLAIGNTIRLAIESRRDEIVIAKLVGGTDGFVRRPFLYTGAWYGLIGGVLACILVIAGFASISGTVRALADTYRSDFVLQGLGFGGSLMLLMNSMLLGLLGAWLAVARHLSDIEPK